MPQIAQNKPIPIPGVVVWVTLLTPGATVVGLVVDWLKFRPEIASNNTSPEAAASRKQLFVHLSPSAEVCNSVLFLYEITLVGILLSNAIVARTVTKLGINFLHFWWIQEDHNLPKFLNGRCQRLWDWSLRYQFHYNLCLRARCQIVSALPSMTICWSDLF